MIQHTFTHDGRKYIVQANLAEGFAWPEPSPRDRPVLNDLSHEILRLAQREVDLLAMGERLVDRANAAERQCDALKVDLAAARGANDLLGGKINSLEQDAADARRLADEQESEVKRLERLAEEHRVAIENMERLVTEREHQLVLAKETVASLRELDVNRQRVILGLREQLAASESCGRQYVLELAEKAGRVRELEEQLAAEIMAHQGTKMAAEDRADELKKLAAERLDFINSFHPQAVATGEENMRLRTEVDELKAILREHGLLPAKYEDEEPRVQATAAGTGQHFAQGEVPVAGPRIWRAAGSPLEETVAGLRDRVADAEQNLDCLREDFSAATEALMDRLKSLEESRSVHLQAITHLKRAAGEPPWTKADLVALLARVGAIEDSLAPAEGDPDEHFHKGWAEASEMARAALDRVCPAHTGAPGKNSDTPADFRSSGE